MPAVEFIGTLQFKEKKRFGNPIALYVERAESECRVSARAPEWRHIVGVGATVNKAAGDFEIKLKAMVPPTLTYDGPSWTGGVKAEKPAPPKPPPSSPKPEPAAAPGKSEAGASAPSSTSPAEPAPSDTSSPMA